MAFLTLLAPGWGGVASLLIWLSSRRTLPRAAFHAAQATLMHAALVLALAAAGLALVLVPWVTGSDPAANFALLFAIGVTLFGLSALLSLIGAAIAWRSTFRVPGLARLLEPS